MKEQDIFEFHFEQYKQTSLAGRLARKYASIPYYLKYKEMRQLALVSSYVFNLFSALTAASLVFFFVHSLSERMILSVLITILFLGMLELTKRQVCSSLFKDWYSQVSLNISMLLFALVLSAISTGFSYYGSQQLVTKLSPPPLMETKDTLINVIETKMTSITAQIEAARNTKYRGTTTTSSQRTIEVLTNQLANLENEMLRLRQKNEAANERTQLVHQEYTQYKAHYFAMATLALELFFFFSISYLEYYDFRSFVEMTGPSMKPTNRLKETPIANSQRQVPPNTLKKSKPANTTLKSTDQAKIKQLKSQIATARYRLKNGVGKKETAERNLREGKDGLEKLKGLTMMGQ